MARIMGVDLPREKKIEISLTYLYGIGLTTAKAICKKAGIKPETRSNSLSEEEGEEDKMQKILNMPISEIELSVRSANCIHNANIKTIGELISKSEPEMLKYRNFGKKSLNEIKAILTTMGLSLGMKIETELAETPVVAEEALKE